jgi:hypothetical protein
MDADAHFDLLDMEINQAEEFLLVLGDASEVQLAAQARLPLIKMDIVPPDRSDPPCMKASGSAAHDQDLFPFFRRPYFHFLFSAERGIDEAFHTALAKYGFHAVLGAVWSDIVRFRLGRLGHRIS